MTLSRRKLLAGLGAGLALAPFANHLAPRASAQPTPTRRLLVIASYFGTIPFAWRPSGSETSFELSRILAPLERHRAAILPLGGIGSEAAHHTGGDGHMRGVVCNLTAAPIHEGGDFETYQSIDQHVADLFDGTTPRRSVELAVQGASSDGWTWRGPGQMVPTEADPRAAWSRLFGDFAGGSSGDLSAERALAQRRSVLDHQLRAVSRLRSRMPSADRARLDQHLEHLRELERRLSGTSSGPTCASPGEPTAGDPHERLRAQSDLMVTALACGITHVGTLVWRSDQWPRFGIGNDHELSHEPITPGSDPVERIVERCRWQAEEVAHVLDRLSEVPEGDGTMLDHTLVLWTNELATGWHEHRNIPYVLMGNVPDASGAPTFRTGRWLEYPEGTPSNDLFVSLAQAFGSTITRFGDRRWSRGPLDGLR